MLMWGSGGGNACTGVEIGWVKGGGGGWNQAWISGGGLQSPTNRSREEGKATTTKRLG